MTKRLLQRRLVLIVGALILLVVLGASARALGLSDAYEVLKDFSVPLVAVAAAVLAHLFQRRATFLSVLSEQWSEMVEAKAAVVRYCEAAQCRTPDTDEYFDTHALLSQVIDEMRVVYRNVGETSELVGFYPYSPLHHIRLQFETLDPRAENKGDPAVIAEEVREAFNAIREHFLDEFDPPEPTRPLLIHAARREKAPGAARHARAVKDRQVRARERAMQDEARK